MLMAHELRSLWDILVSALVKVMASGCRIPPDTCTVQVHCNTIFSEEALAVMEA